MANFCCTFSIWFQFNGKDLPEGPKYRTKVRGNKVSLTMFEVTQDMTGYYTCIAKNELGTDTTRASMTVNKALSPGTPTSFWDNFFNHLHSFVLHSFPIKLILSGQLKVQKAKMS